MGKLREANEGLLDFPQESEFLVDDINFYVINCTATSNLHTDRMEYFWFDSHHVMEKEEELLRQNLNPWYVTYHPELSRWGDKLPCPQPHFRGYRNEKGKRQIKQK